MGQADENCKKKKKLVEGIGTSNDLDDNAKVSYDNSAIPLTPKRKKKKKKGSSGGGNSKDKKSAVTVKENGTPSTVCTSISEAPSS